MFTDFEIQRFLLMQNYLVSFVLYLLQLTEHKDSKDICIDWVRVEMAANFRTTFSTEFS